MKTWTVFDLEFTELLEWQDNIHIACASILSSDESVPQVWYEQDNSDYLSVSTIEAFVDELHKKSQTNTLVTWGGSASDWRMLYRECPTRSALIRELALKSVDVPMCSCMAIGTMMGLNAACSGLGLTIKESDDSKLVPDLWRRSDNLDETLERRFKVLQHVSNDAYGTLQVVQQAEHSKTLPWITKKNQLKIWNNVVFLTVAECLKKELPSVGFPIGPNQNAKLMARWLVFEL